jgi:predicted TIM-barrel enzyme
MGYDKEVEMIGLARELDLLTCPYVHNTSEAESMARAGADVVVPHVGLTSKGMIGARSAISLDDAARRVQEMADAAKAVRREILVLCHGGPIAEPADAAHVLARASGIHGFFGASSIERLPTEPAITEQVRKFSSLRLSRS